MELKACPFCGGKASFFECEHEWQKLFIVSCEECGITTPASDDEAKLADLWNNRVS